MPGYSSTSNCPGFSIYDVMRRAVSEQRVRHLILFIGDGMQLAHEVAGSRYLHGEDTTLSWHLWSLHPDRWRGFATTWDVTIYNNYAGDADAKK